MVNSKKSQPTSFDEASTSPKSKETMDDEINVLHECGTWEIVSISCKIKYKPDGVLRGTKQGW